MTNKGFTFIEIMVAVAILILIFGLGGDMGLKDKVGGARRSSKMRLAVIIGLLIVVVVMFYFWKEMFLSLSMALWRFKAA